MEYLTWRQLRDATAKLSDEQLDEPVLFATLDAYGSETVVPVELLLDTWHPNDDTRTLHYNEDSEHYERFEPGQEQEEEGWRPLRKLPRNMPLLSFSEMEEDVEERNAWLAKPNPHSLPPAPKVPGPAPLFE